MIWREEGLGLKDWDDEGVYIITGTEQQKSKKYITTRQS